MRALTRPLTKLRCVGCTPEAPPARVAEHLRQALPPLAAHHAVGGAARKLEQGEVEGGARILHRVVLAWGGAVGVGDQGQAERKSQLAVMHGWGRKPRVSRS
jgi:hypothetical protein